MKKSRLVNMTAVLFFTISIATGCSLFRNETVVTMAQVPPPVRSAIEKITAGNTIKQIEKIESGGKVTYEVEYMKDGKEHEAYFADDGKMVKGVQ